VDGEAVSLVCVDELKLLADIEKLIKQKLPKEVVVGFEPDPKAKAEPIPNGRQQQRQGQGQPRSRSPEDSAPKPKRKRTGARTDARPSTLGNRSR
jgi:ATP-dependent RNA helicase RhlE